MVTVHEREVYVPPELTFPFAEAGRAALKSLGPPDAVLPSLAQVPLPFAEPTAGTNTNFGEPWAWPSAPYLLTLTDHLHRFPRLLSLTLTSRFALAMNNRLAAALTPLCATLTTLHLELGGVRDHHIQGIRAKHLRTLRLCCLEHISDLSTTVLAKGSVRVVPHRLALRACGSGRLSLI